MPPTRPSIFSMCIWVYWDLVQALRTAWRSALIATVILLVGVIAASVVPFLLTRDPIGQVSVRQVILIGLCFLLTPFLLAIHRGLLLGEWTTRYDLATLTPRFQLYFGWLAMSVLMLGIPSFLDALTVPRGPVYYDANHPLTDSRSPIVTVVRLATWVVVQNCLVLFPAVAVDARGATWQNAIGDTRRHIWFVLAVTILPFIPIVLLNVAILSLLRTGHGSYMGLAVSVLCLGVMCLVALMLAAVIASRLYQVVGDRLNTPSR